MRTKKRCCIDGLPLSAFVDTTVDFNNIVSYEEAPAPDIPDIDIPVRGPAIYVEPNNRRDLLSASYDVATPFVVPDEPKKEDSKDLGKRRKIIIIAIAAAVLLFLFTRKK